jgi:hypothetical protein
VGDGNEADAIAHAAGDMFTALGVVTQHVRDGAVVPWAAAEGRRSGRSGEKEMTENRRGSAAVVHQRWLVPRGGAPLYLS